MGLGQRLAQSVNLVEAYLEQVLDRAAADGAPARLVAAMRHAALGGGKRLRPFLVMECAGLFGVAAQTALPAAAALECVHCYSLAHDDLPPMDDDAVRRGQPTVHKAFDEWTAILAGDALLTLAFDLLAGVDAHPDPRVRCELVARLAAAAGAAGMVGGQCLDLEADKLNLPPRPTLAHVQRLQAMKTGALIRFACEAGAILGGAGAGPRGALVSFGQSIGAAFQIADDLLDIEGDAATVGKATGKDDAKATLVTVMGLEPAKARLNEIENEALAALSIFGREADVLRAVAAFVIRREK